MPKYSELLFDKLNPTNETPLHWAVQKNNYQIVKELIKDYESSILTIKDSISTENLNSRNFLDLKNTNWHTPFFIAIIKGFLEVASLLL